MENVVIKFLLKQASLHGLHVPTGTLSLFSCCGRWEKTGRKRKENWRCRVQPYIQLLMYTIRGRMLYSDKHRLRGSSESLKPLEGRGTKDQELINPRETKKGKTLIKS